MTAGVGRAQLVAMFVGAGVDFLGELQAVAARFGQADELFEPGGAGGLDVHARVEVAVERAADGRINGELVAAGVDAELERSPGSP